MNTLQQELLDDAMGYVEKGLSLLSENTSTMWYLYLIRGKIHLKKVDRKVALEEFTSSAKEANRMHLPYGEIAADYTEVETDDYWR